jgi:hypothetical protein
MNLEEFLAEIAQAIRSRVEGGRSHGEVAVELHLERSVVSRIVRGERRIGFKTFYTIVEADPPWLREVLAGNPALNRGSNGKGRKPGGS